MEDKKRVKINLMGIISVLTLIIMGLGSTFAYFTAIGNANLGNATVSSLEIILNLKIAPLYTGKAILPTNDEDIITAFNKSCIDDAGNGACLAYTVELENKGAEQEGIVIFEAESDTITNLKYMILDNDNNYAVVKEPTSAMIPEDEVTGIPINLPKDIGKKLITVVVWISNLDEPQDHEQGGEFFGKATFTATSGAKLTGTMNDNVIVG